ncbi:MAG TPA: Coq4 family protein [Coleofasciculaceae cyanobacterium]
MQTSAAPLHPSTNLRIARFLKGIDHLSDALGTSVPPIVNLDELRSLPPGTLGRAWADSLDQHQLQPFTTGFRRKQLHDGVHVLTGYGIDPIGEAEVQAFLIGAKFHLTHVILGLGLLRQIRQQSSLSNPIKLRLQQAYQRGQQAQFDVDSWQPELMWDLPLEEVRSQLGIA